jgi:hypothetical protein
VYEHSDHSSNTFASATGSSTELHRWSVLELAKSTGSIFYQTARRHPEEMVFIAA